MSNYGVNKYKQTSITTANRGQILIMLYEAAIRHLRTAQESMKKKDMNQKGIALGKAHDIIAELANTLDFKIGGKIAENLEKLYQFALDQITKSNMNNDHTLLNSPIKTLENLLEAWRVAVSEFNKAQAEGTLSLQVSTPPKSTENPQQNPTTPAGTGSPQKPPIGKK